MNVYVIKRKSIGHHVCGCVQHSNLGSSSMINKSTLSMDRKSSYFNKTCLIISYPSLGFVQCRILFIFHLLITFIVILRHKQLLSFSIIEATTWRHTTKASFKMIEKVISLMNYWHLFAISWPLSFLILILSTIFGFTLLWLFSYTL